MDRNGSSSYDEKEEAEKMSPGDSRKKRKRGKRTSSDSQKPTVDASSSNVEEASQPNNRTQKNKRKSTTSAENEEAVEKVRTPMFTDPGLPFGWRRECVQRKTGRTEGHYDVYIFNPEGKKFRSRVELAKFLAATNSNLDPEDFDFSVYGCKASPNSATRRKIKAILEMNNSDAVVEKEEAEESKSVTQKPDKQPESGDSKRTSGKRGRKPKDKIPTQPQKKARLKFTPTIKELFKCARQNPFCLDCGKEGCKYPYVVLENPPRPLDLLVKEGIKYR